MNLSDILKIEFTSEQVQVVRGPKGPRYVKIGDMLYRLTPCRTPDAE